MKLRFSRPAGRFLALAAAAGLLQLLFRLCLRAEGDGGAALLIAYLLKPAVVRMNQLLKKVFRKTTPRFARTFSWKATGAE